MRMRPNLLLALVCALVLATLVAASAQAVEVNEATLAQLEQISGLGPSLAERVIAQRQQKRFSDWADFIGRVPGLGQASAVRLSAAGLTVNGRALPPRSTAAAPDSR